MHRAGRRILGNRQLGIESATDKIAIVTRRRHRHATTGKIEQTSHVGLERLHRGLITHDHHQIVATKDFPYFAAERGLQQRRALNGRQIEYGEIHFQPVAMARNREPSTERIELHGVGLDA